jgi:hypothetical protein
MQFVAYVKRKVEVVVVKRVLRGLEGHRELVTRRTCQQRQQQGADWPARNGELRIA